MTDSDILLISAAAGFITVGLTGLIVYLKVQWDQPEITPLLELYMNRYDENVEEGIEIGVEFELRVRNRQATVRGVEFVVYWPNGDVDVDRPRAWGNWEGDWVVYEKDGRTNYFEEITPEKPLQTRFTVAARCGGCGSCQTDGR